jgi:AcrR family transcriptional regulator
VVIGLRERKKRETRRSISDIATTLFMAKGFDNTTIAEIAEAAGVSPQTVANYFPTKTDLFFDEDGWRIGPRPRSSSTARRSRRRKRYCVGC